MKKTAGILLYRTPKTIQVLLVKNGRNKWSIPKGQIGKREKMRLAARRELKEETTIGIRKVVQLLGKVFNGEDESLTCFFAEAPRSRKPSANGEIVKAKFFELDKARKKIEKYQAPLLDRLIKKLAAS